MLKFFPILLLSLLFACNSAQNEQSNPNQITIAASSIPQADLLKHIRPELEEEGFSLKIQIVDDYNIPNRALSDGDIDANFFQHKPFLEEQIKQFHYPLCPLAEIHIEPIGIYSQKNRSIQEIPEQGVIAIPNDPTNEARALLLLEKEGLISLNGNNIYSTTILDIKSNPKKLKFKEIDSALLTRTLSEVNAAVIPTNYALLAGINPEKESLALESKESPYVNVLVIRCSDKSSPKLLALKKAMESDAMRSYILTEYKGALLPAF